jgi:hypothetical protein
MSDNQGSADNQQVSDDVEKNQKKDSVSYETYQRVLAEAKTAKEKAKLLEQEKQANHENKLKEQNEWKLLAEQKEKSYLELKAELDLKNEQEAQMIKLSAFQKHLGGKVKNKEYYRFVDVEKIAINPDTLTVDEDSVKNVVAEFVKTHPSLVEFKAGKMPNEAGSTGKISDKDPSQMSAMELENYIKSLHATGRL